ncbi:MAG: gamma subclass chorismate mutase AroQ [Waddliaceae bacterium]
MFFRRRFAFALFFIFAVAIAPIHTLMAAEAACSCTPPHVGIALAEKIKEIDFALFLIQKRLSVCHEVARWKWNKNVDIDDPVYERQMLKKIGKLATAYGLDKEWAAKFFQAQLAASNMIQTHDFEYWHSQHVQKHPQCADLHTEIRPYLDRLTKELLEALVAITPYLEDKTLLPLLLEQPLSTRQSDLIDEEIWQQAIAPFYEYGL